MADYIHVNLLPIEYRVVRKDYSWIIDLRLLTPLAALALAGVAWVMVGSYFDSNLQTQRGMLASVEQEIAQNADVAQKITELEKLRDDKTAKNNSLKSISVSKKRWVRILEGVNKSLPLNMWIESIRQADGNDNELEIKGRTFVFPEVAEYMMELGKNEFFQAATLGTIEFTKEGDRASFQFNIRVTINPNAGVDILVKDEKREEKVL
jgi:Tfp pilus assembly protein PilN